jgi:glycosyltransferase involved in cell wall biosynthesis
VANLIPRKEVHTLLAALARLPLEEWRLRVAGSLTMDPAYVRAIQAQIADTGLTGRVELLGTLADQDLAALLAKSQVQAVPSSYEGLGIVYLEGMRLGLPAIASTSGAAHEVIAHGWDGFLVPPGDVDALSHCLGLLLRDRELLLAMSLAALQRSATHPTWGGTVARVHRFLHQFKSHS